MEKQNVNKFKGLATNRLVLRALALTDSEQMAIIRSDEEVNKYINRQACLSVAEAEAFVKKIKASVANGESFYWAICLKEDDQLIGTVCLWNIDKECAQAELGYELLPLFQGKGIMSEAIGEVVRFAFDELLFKSIVAITHRDNGRSVGLLKRFGFVSNPDHQDEAGLLEDEVSLILKASLNG